MSNFTARDLPSVPDRHYPTDDQVRRLLPVLRRGYSYAGFSGPTEWSGAKDEHDNKLVGAIQTLWPALAEDRRLALLPELPPVPEGERYHREFEASRSHVMFDMPSEKLTVSVHGGGLAAAEQALLVALAMVRAGAALGPQLTGQRTGEVEGRVALDTDPHGLPVNPT